MNQESVWNFIVKLLRFSTPPQPDNGRKKISWAGAEGALTETSVALFIATINSAAVTACVDISSFCYCFHVSFNFILLNSSLSS